jgi:hypothetical protein
MLSWPRTTEMLASSRGSAARASVANWRRSEWVWASLRQPPQDREQENPAHKEPGGVSTHYNAVPV